MADLGAYGLPLMAFVGAVVAAFLVYRLATFSGETSSASLLLSGVAVGSTFTAIMTFFLLLDEQNMRTVVVWHLGGLGSASWSKILLAGTVVGAGFVYMLANADRLNLLLMGPDRAQELGIDAHATRRNLLIAGALTTGRRRRLRPGLIGFVGLMVPHMVRLLLGPDHRRLLPATALFGAVFLLLCDTVARTAFAPMEIPVGIITAFIGGPFFLYLLRHRRGV